MDYEVDEFSENVLSQKSLANAQWANPVDIANKFPYSKDCIWLGRNPHNPDQAIGYQTEKHIFIAAESGGGKGRAFMVNNQVLWPGSMIAIGPKGDEATITAQRRGPGNEHCQGMDQDVYVLDPMHSSVVPEDYRAYYDLLDGLDPNDPALVRKTSRIADAICEVATSGDSAEWQKRGKQWVARIIQHVITDPWLLDEQRNLLTVRNFAQQGDVDGAEELYQHQLKKAENPSALKRPDAYTTLLHKMKANTAADGAISRAARNMLQTQSNSPRQFEGVRGSAADHFEWLEGKDIEQVVCKRPGGPQRTFTASDIKNKFVSIYVHLPEQDYPALKVWLRGIITSLIQNLSATQGVGANGHRVLFSIDEFGNLGTMDIITESFNSIRSAGVSLMLATQGLTSLQKNYPKDWSRFPSAAGIEIYFQADEPELADFIEKKLGKTEVVKYARSVNKNTNFSTARAVTEGYSHTHSLSVGHSDAVTRSTTIGQTVSKSKSETLSRGKNKSSSTGKNKGTNVSKGYSTSNGYGPAMFWHGLANSWMSTLNRGESGSDGSSKGSSSNRSAGVNVQNSKTKGSTTSNTISDTEGETHTETKNETHGKTENHSTTDTESSGGGQGAAIQESFHIQPLLSALEARQTLIAPAEMDHAAYPGLALILIDQEKDPFFIRKANYDQDPFFIDKFTPNPAFKFTPYDQLPLMGWQITPEHFLEVVLPNELELTNCEIQNKVFKDKVIAEGDRLLHVVISTRWEDYSPNKEFIKPAKTEQFKALNIYSPIDGRVVALRADNDEENTRYIFTFRANRPLSIGDQDEISEAIWGDAIQTFDTQKSKFIQHIELERERQRKSEEEKARQEAEARIAAERLAEQKARERRAVRIRLILRLTAATALASIALAIYGVIQWNVLVTIPMETVKRYYPNTRISYEVKFNVWESEHGMMYRSVVLENMEQTNEIPIEVSDALEYWLNENLTIDHCVVYGGELLEHYSDFMGYHKGKCVTAAKCNINLPTDLKKPERPNTRYGYLGGKSYDRMPGYYRDLREWEARNLLKPPELSTDGCYSPEKTLAEEVVKLFPDNFALIN